MNANNGRLTDVLIEEIYIHNQNETGIRKFNNLSVWADEGMKEVIESVEGVVKVYSTYYKTKYDVYVDPRYERNFILAEIEAAVKCV